MIPSVEGETRILIQPGHTFGVVDALLTNFTSLVRRFLPWWRHFAGRQRILAAYEEAVRRWLPLLLVW